MTRKPTYEELEQRIRVLEEESIKGKLAEDALRESEARYRDVINNAQEAIIITQEGKAVLVNRATVELTEYSADTLTSRPFTEFIYPDDRNMVIENHIKRLQGEEAPRIYSYRVIKHDGSIKWAETNSINIQWKGRLAVLSFLNDITERKKAEEALQKSEEKYRRITDNMTDIVSEANAQGILTYVGPSHRRKFGDNPDNLIGTFVFDRVHPEDRNRIMAEYTEGIQTKTDREVEYRYRHVDGNYIWVCSSGRAMYDDQGEYAGMIVCTSDINERKRAEEALQKSEERYRTILEEMEEGYQEVDLAGNYTFFNDAYVRVFGYSRDEMMGTNFSLYSAEEDMTNKILYAYNQMYKTGIPIRSFEWDIIRKDGARRTLEFYASVIKHANRRSIGFRAIIRDITDRKRAEEALQKSEQRYRLLVENANEAILVIQDGMVRYANEKAVESFGYSTQEFLLIPVFGLIHPDDREQVVSRYLQKIQGDATPTRHTYKALHKSGLTQWIEVSSVLIGSVKSFMKTSTDK